MPKSSVAGGAGNINMKGKKHVRLRCGCCDCIDFRGKELKKDHRKYIAESVEDVYGSQEKQTMDYR